MTSGTNEKLVSVPSDCPEYVRCNAPICPLDARWLDRTFSSGEPTCLFLRESVKKGAADRLNANRVFAELFAVSQRWLASERQAVTDRGDAGMPRGRAEHLRAVVAAAKTGSTLDKRAAAGIRLAAVRNATLTGSTTDDPAT